MIQRWLDLPHRALTDEVHQLVRSRDEEAFRGWALVREHPVLAARVRGILSALERQTADYRDAAMWRVWISQARTALAPQATRVAPAATQPAPAVPVPSVTRAAAPGRVRPPAPAPLVFREPGK